MEYKIYSQSGTLKASFNPGSSTHTHEAMLDNVLNLTFTLNEYVALEVNDYIDINADRFTLLEPYKPVVKNTMQFEYNVKFYGAESIAKKAQFVDDNYQPITSYYDTPSAQLRAIVKCINRVVGSNRYSVGAVVSSAAISVDYSSGANCFQALTTLANATDTEWWLDGINFNLAKCEHGDTVVLGYGTGLLSLDKEITSDSSFFTRLIPIGSTKNIVKSTYGNSRLQLPGGIKYVDQNVNQYGIVEKVVEDAFADIYPRFTGTVGSVRTETKTIEGIERTVYYFTDTTMGFNPNDYAVAGLVKHIVFKSGDLNGRDFEANWYPSKGEWELINQYTDESTQMPGGYIIPRTGDTYTIYNIEMPSVYRTNAEAEYLAAVQAYLAKYAIDFSIYKAATDHVYLEDNNITLTLGRRVRLVSDKYFSSGSRDSRITKITRKLSDLNQMDIEVSNVISKGAYSQLKDDISNLKTRVNEQLSTDILQIIKSFNASDLTDDNVLSSLRVLKEIKNRAISKTEADTAQKLIEFLEGLVTDDVKSKLYSEGPLGSGMRFWMQDGKSYGEIDNLMVRMETVFNKLTIAEQKSVGGQILVTIADIECNRVEDMTTVYRCYFDNQDGTIPNKFVINDQARCQTFTGNKQKYYWRLVVAVGSNYIDLSKTDYDGSGVPAARDSIIQLGHRTDSARQNAILFSAYGADAPSLKQYAGINSYSLTGKEKTVISPSGNKLTVGASHDEVAGKIWVSDNYSTIEQTDSKIALTVSQATQGGRNLLKNSDFKNAFASWSTGGNIAIDNSVTILGMNPIKYTGSSSAIGYINLYQQVAPLLKPSTKYTLSCYAKYSGNQIANTFGLYVEGNVSSYPTLPTGSSDWKKHILTFTTPETLTDVRVGWYFAPNVANNCLAWLTMFQLEEGISATDWFPSNDDLADKTWVGKNYSSITQTAENIALEIGKVQIGGRNLIPNSSNIYNITQKQLEGNYTHNVSDKDGGNNATQIAFDRAGGLFRIGQANTNSLLKISGNTYTYSTWIYPVVGSQVALWISAIEGPVINLVADKWQRISFTATMAEGVWHDAWRFVDIRGINAGDTFKLYHPQVEVGNKLSDWSLNPDDTATKDKILSLINLSQEDIKIAAEKISLEGTVTANNNFKIRKDGVAEMKGAIVEGMIKALSGSIGKFSIVDGDIIGFDSSNVERVRFSSNPLPAVSSLFTGYSIISDSLDETFDDYFERDVEMGIERTSLTYSVRTNITLNAASNLRIDGQGGDMTVLGNLLPVETITKTDIIRIYNSQGVLITTGELYYPINVNATGIITIELESTFTIHNMSNGYRYSTVVDMGWQGIQLQGTTEKTYIGSDGYYSVFGSGEYIYFKRGSGLICKGKSDMPGVLASGSISSGGTQTNRWGAKSYNLNATKGGTGIFNIPHLIGNTSYTVNVVCNAADCIAYVSGKSSNAVQITVRKSGSNYDCGFDYTIIGAN